MHIDASEPRRVRRFSAHFTHYKPSEVIAVFFELSHINAIVHAGVRVKPPLETNIFVADVRDNYLRFDCANRAVRYWSYELELQQRNDDTELEVFFIDYTPRLPMSLDWFDPRMLDQDISGVVQRTNGTIQP